MAAKEDECQLRAGMTRTASEPASLRGVDINCAESWLLPSEVITLWWRAGEFFPCAEGTQPVSCSGCTRFASSQTALQITGAEAHPRSTSHSVQSWWQEEKGKPDCPSCTRSSGSCARHLETVANGSSGLFSFKCSTKGCVLINQLG